MDITIKVKTKAQVNQVEKLADSDNAYLVSTRELPHAGKANLAVVKLLADYFKTSQANIVIKKGLKSKLKQVRILE